VLTVEGGGATSRVDGGGGSKRGSAGGRGIFEGLGFVLRVSSTGFEAGAPSVRANRQSLSEHPRPAQRLPMRRSTTFTVSMRMDRSNQRENVLM
jgi:hypothetical protein